jgi:hypothetical protein
MQDFSPLSLVRVICLSRRSRVGQLRRATAE